MQHHSLYKNIHTVHILSSLSVSSQMGFKIQSGSSSRPNYLYYFPIFLSLILFFLLISPSSADQDRTTQQLHGGASSTTTTTTTRPFLVRAVHKANKLQMKNEMIKSKNKNKISKKKKKKITAATATSKSNNNNNGNKKARAAAFSVMLPKGFVPPSGSSPCHNENPQSYSSLAFYCHLSATTNIP